MWIHTYRYKFMKKDTYNKTRRKYNGTSKSHQRKEQTRIKYHLPFRMCIRKHLFSLASKLISSHLGGVTEVDWRNTQGFVPSVPTWLSRRPSSHLNWLTMSRGKFVPNVPTLKEK